MDCIFILHLSERPCLGLVERRLILPCASWFCPAQLEYSHWCVYYYMVRDPTHWSFGEIIVGPAILLSVSLWLFCLAFLEGGSEVFWGTWWRFLCYLDWGLCLDLHGGINCCCRFAYSFNWMSLPCLLVSFKRRRFCDTLLLSSPYMSTVTGSLSYLIFYETGRNRE